jgi:hypothetical protein
MIERSWDELEGVIALAWLATCFSPPMYGA